MANRLLVVVLVGVQQVEVNGQQCMLEILDTVETVSVCRNGARRR